LNKTAELTGGDRPGTAILMLVGGVSSYALMDGFTKIAVVDGADIVTAMWIRFLFATAFVVAVAVPVHGTAVFRTSGKGLLILRGVFPLIASYLAITAFSQMPMADVTALLFVAPLFATALSIPLLGEKVGLFRWAAVIAGFCGVLLIVQPSPQMQPVTLYPLMTALLFAFFTIMTRRLRLKNHPMAMLFYAMITGCVLMLPVLPFYWQTPSFYQFGLIFLAGFFYAAAQFGVTMAFTLAEASRLTPFIYTQIICAIGFGWVVFEEVPILTTWVGTSVIVGSGLIVWNREKSRQMK